MATQTNTYAGNRLQNREDLSDVIAALSPMDAPLYSKLTKTKATNVYHEYNTQVETRGNQAAYAEGAAFGQALNLTPTRNVNYVERQATAYQVTRDQIITDTVGGKNELARQRMYALRKWRTSMEFDIIWGSGISGTSGSARVMKGFLELLTNATNASGQSLTEQSFNSYQQLVWENSTGQTQMTFLSPSLKRTVSTQFITSTTKNLEESQVKTLGSRIDVYESDFGVTQLYPHRDLSGSNRLFIFREEAARLAIMDNPRDKEIAVTGDYEAGAISGAGTLELNFPTAGISVSNQIAG